MEEHSLSLNIYYMSTTIDDLNNMNQEDLDKLIDQEWWASSEDGEFEVRPNSICKPRSQWRSLKPWYIEWCKERAKKNPLLIP